jgi:hypothetical protein
MRSYKHIYQRVLLDNNVAIIVEGLVSIMGYHMSCAV